MHNFLDAAIANVTTSVAIVIVVDALHATVAILWISNHTNAV